MWTSLRVCSHCTDRIGRMHKCPTCRGGVLYIGYAIEFGRRCRIHEYDELQSVAESYNYVIDWVRCTHCLVRIGCTDFPRNSFPAACGLVTRAGCKQRLDDVDYGWCNMFDCFAYSNYRIFLNLICCRGLSMTSAKDDAWEFVVNGVFTFKFVEERSHIV